MFELITLNYSQKYANFIICTNEPIVFFYFLIVVMIRLLYSNINTGVNDKLSLKHAHFQYPVLKFSFVFRNYHLSVSALLVSFKIFKLLYFE